MFETRARVVAGIRTFLDARGFLEVETPMMQPMAGGALARPFTTHHNALDIDLYLRIAPELYLKRLTVGGFERVYEINRNFRNEGISTQHNPEFTMLEFYEAYVDYEHLMQMTEEMLTEIVRERDAAASSVPFGDHTISFAAPYRRLSLRHAAAEAATRRLARTGHGAGSARPRSRGDVARALGLDVAASHGAGKIATTIFETLWEDELVQPTFVYDFPTEVSPLSKQKAERSRHRRALRALRGRLRDRQRLQRAERPGRSSAAASRRSCASAPPATPRRTRWTRTTSARSNTACRRPAAKASASIGS